MKNPDNNHSSHDNVDVPREHVFDGIQEYDNKLPNWWLMTLYGAIVFSIGYWFVYHITGVAPLPEEKLAAAQARSAALAAAKGGDGFTEERLIAMSLETGIVGKAQAAYATNCAACHGANADGGIGPNLKDGTWIHGGNPADIFNVIQNGVPAKGMPAWKTMLGESGSAELTAFIISLNPDGFQNISPGDGGNAEPPAATETL